ncbi:MULTISPECIES: GNAT family N-acetyltransferase [Streptomycetaceae]|uniref:Acetyltransferase n=1 Tax=Streptantibioticus cattleyicolor (strain ATCC 35852 / DSM 46488 / JCM 4925 / NBRC 14057 / NRRL 8057) TaxID=1003195 RepID=G8X179_STREN|nr:MULTISPECIES: GNAT family N-acetyltransferase [Streptomycetaceae]AEW97947.1 acetyltransferase [Streptantibioticus cattleyicolor NRRL 8057 = DSM 46488]MYS62351.1 GNAT family N-acetyltransferase [Streptomyces sp. SID5468]
MTSSIPPVVAAGRMARGEQPVLGLSDGEELRPWRAEDAGVLAASCGDPAIRQWNRTPALTIREAEERIDNWRRRWWAEERAVWAIARRGGEVLGLIGVGDIDLGRGGGELFYWLLPAGQGGGTMTRAVLRVARWALDEVGLHRLVITHSVANPASCRVAEATGFRLEGTMRGALLHADGWHDEHLHARLQGDPWP